MEAKAFDVLNEPLIRIRLGSGVEGRSLPEVLALLAGGEGGVEFRQLQPHQEPAWHAFLVQVSAMALARADRAEVPRTPTAWRDLLLGLAGDSAEAWCLVVSDLSQPAFFQPPIPEGKLSPLKNEAATPEAISVLVTAKNHDVKSERYRSPALDDWIYALVTLQTTEGFSGRMNYGIARMNGGFGSRPQVAATTSLDWSTRFRRDLSLCLDLRQTLLESGPGFCADGIALLWLPAWTGDQSSTVDELDPLFVEICRRVRLRLAEDGGLRVRWGTSENARVDAKELSGNLGDPWTPIRVEDGAALTLSDRGFDYRMMSKLIFSGGFAPAPAQRFDPRDPGVPSITARVLVRGQGKTGGFHHRVVPLHKTVARKFGKAETKAQLGAIAEGRIAETRDTQNKVLKPAILALHQGGPDDKLNFKDAAADPYVEELDAEIDRIFFERLWADCDLDSGERTRRWHQTLFDEAEKIFRRAIDRAPRPDARHYRAVAAAERAFYGAARHVLKAAFDETSHSSTESTEEGSENAA